jgi:branched-chain amino acid transport system permease protein
MRLRTLGWIVLLAALLAVPFTGIYPVFMMQIYCFAIFACAFNLLLGFTGLLSFGHAAFFGVSAYVTGWLVTAHGYGPLLATTGGVLAAMVMGLLIGGLAIRRQGIYLAMVTLALAQLVAFVCLEAPFTGGENGLQGIHRGTLLGLIPLQSDRVLYYVILAILMLVYLFIIRIVHSPFGQVLKAIRENEQRAISLGYAIQRYKLVAFVLSAGLSGLAGSLKAIVLGFTTLSDVAQANSSEVILMTLLGGTGTFLGPAIGAATVVTLEHYLADIAGSWVYVVMGIIFILCVIGFRRGIVGMLKSRW